MQHAEFLRERMGNNWVLGARRTDRLVRRYGESVNVVTRKRYAAIEKEWRAMYGDPYDKVRAELYQALAQAHMALLGVVGMNEIVRAAGERAEKALAAEREVR